MEDKIDWDEIRKSHSLKMRMWENPKYHKLGYAGDLLSGAMVCGLFNENVENLCEWVINNEKSTLSMKNIAKSILNKNGK